MFRFFIVAISIFFSFFSQANVVILGTRIVYEQQNKVINVELRNKGQVPSLIQAWIDDGSNQQNIQVPFIITPPVSRVEAGTQQTLRIRYTGESLPQDRESLFYFNLFDIPPKPSKQDLAKNPNYLQFAINNKLKFFFRPSGLPYTVSDAYKKVQWKLKGNILIVDNSTPYYITYDKVAVKQGNKRISVKDTSMVAPFSTAKFNLTNTVNKATEIEWSIIDDFGSSRLGISSLN